MYIYKLRKYSKFILDLLSTSEHSDGNPLSKINWFWTSSSDFLHSQSKKGSQCSATRPRELFQDALDNMLFYGLRNKENITRK